MSSPSDRFRSPGDDMNDQHLALHDWVIAEREYERHAARRGRRFAYERFDPTRTALVVVDMVGFFAADSAYVRGIVPTIASTAEAFRRAGAAVAWVLPVVAPPGPWASGFYGDRIARRYGESGGDGTPEERLAAGVGFADGDLTAQKSAPSAFFPGRCDLPDTLRERGIERVVIAGTVTSVCCESTARDASTLGFEVAVLGDATADVSDAAHNAALRTIYRSFGDVRSAADVIALLQSG